MTTPARRLSAPMATLAMLVVLAVGGCRGGDPARDALEETVERLGGVERAQLVMTVRAVPAGDAGDGAVGFRLAGRFALARPGGLPVADLEYTRFAGGDEMATSFVSTGESAFVRLAGETYELPDERVSELRAPDADAESRTLPGLALHDWVREPRLSGSGEVDGVAVDRVTGDLDVAAALADVLDLARGLGAPVERLPRLDGDDADRLERAVDAAHVEVVTTEADRMLRRLTLRVDLAAEASAQLRDALGELAGVRLEVVLEMVELDRPIEVDVPEGARPLAAN